MSSVAAMIENIVRVVDDEAQDDAALCRVAHACYLYNLPQGINCIREQYISIAMY